MSNGALPSDVVALLEPGDPGRLIPCRRCGMTIIRYWYAKADGPTPDPGRTCHQCRERAWFHHRTREFSEFIEWKMARARTEPS